MPMLPCRRVPLSQDPPHGHWDIGVRLKNLSGDEQRRAKLKKSRDGSSTSLARRIGKIDGSLPRVEHLGESRFRIGDDL
jgi:hypothetical protein